MTGADSAEMGQGGMRVNMVPKDGGNSFHGVVFGNYSPSVWASDNCGSPGVGQPCTRQEPHRRHDLQQDRTTSSPTSASSPRTTTSTSASAVRSSGQGVVLRHVPLSRRQQDGRRQLLRPESAGPGKFTPYAPDTSRPGIDDGHIRSIAGRVSCAGVVEGQDLVLPRRAGQGARPLGHRVQRFRPKRRPFRRRRPASCR